MQLLAALEMVVGAEGNRLVERATGLIVDLQRAYLPTSLIYVRLTRDFGVDFEGLVGAFGGLAEGFGGMPKGREKLTTLDFKHKFRETWAERPRNTPKNGHFMPSVSPQQASATPL